jgi:DNA-binding SARP family transcriptional activator
MISTASALALDEMPLESFYAPEPLPLPVLERGQVLFRTLGTAEIHIGGGGVIAPGAERMFSLLTVVGMSHEHVIARESLMEIVWPGMDDTSARHSLRQHVYKLRQLGVEIESSRASVRMLRSTFLPCFALDRTALLFDRDVLKGQEPFGHLFAGWMPSYAVLRRWVEQQRELYHADVRRILVPELRRLRDRGEWEEAERWARTVLEFDPFNEDATLIVAEAVAMLGSRVSASSLLESYVRETGVGGTELGRRVEKAQQRIERAVRLSHDEAATPRLVGRDAELQQLDALTLAAMQGEPRIVRLLGPAGIGKTELAYEVTRRAVILGFTRCLVRVSHFEGSVKFGALSHLVRNLLKLPGALGCSPEALALLRRCAGAETHSGATEQPWSVDPNAQVHECLFELIASLTEEAPLVILLDDLQRADTHSAQAIAQVVDLLQRQRILFVLTERAADSIEREVSSGDTRLASVLLQSLSHRACVELASIVSTPTGRRADLKSADLIATASDKTPLGVIALTREHLLTGLTGGTRVSLAETLARQIRRLLPEERCMVSVVALLGGKVSAADLDDSMGFSLGIRFRAVRCLLDAGLLHEGSTGELACHDEVRRVVLEELSSTEIAFLRRELAGMLNRRLLTRFSSDEAFRALALALESGDSSLFVEVCLQHSGRLSSSGMGDGVLKYLETALNLCAGSVARTSILNAMVIAAERAWSWHLVARATDGLRGQGEAAKPLSLEQQLSQLEACVHTDLQLRGRESAVSALEIAASQHSVPAAKVRAARIALTAASDLFEADIGLRAYSVLVDSLKKGAVRDADVEEPMMQFNTIFGDLTSALESAKRLHERREYHAQSSTGIRLLNHASFVLRVCGDINGAMQCLTTAESSVHVRQSASRLLDNKWRKVVVAFEGSDKDFAVKLGKSFSDESKLPEHQDELWVRLFNLRLEHLETGTLRAAREALTLATTRTETPTRLTLYCTALCLFADDVVSDREKFNAMLERGCRYLSQYGRYYGLDFLAASVLQKLEESGNSQTAKHLCARYFGVDRREQSPVGFVFSGLSNELSELAKSSALALRLRSRR